MNFIKQIERVKRINQLIKHRNTGRPEVFAKKLNISRRQLYNTIELLKDYGIKIQYDRVLESFYYIDNENISIDFSIKILAENEEKTIYAGSFLKKNASVQFLCTEYL